MQHTHTHTHTHVYSTLPRNILCYQRFAAISNFWCVFYVQKVSFGDFSVQEVSNLYTQGTNQLEVSYTIHT